jgi:ribosomal protein L1
MKKQIVTTVTRFPDEQLDHQIKLMVEAYEHLFKDSGASFSISEESIDALKKGEAISFAVVFPNNEKTITTILIVQDE